MPEEQEIIEKVDKTNEEIKDPKGPEQTEVLLQHEEKIDNVLRSQEAEREFTNKQSELEEELASCYKAEKSLIEYIKDHPSNAEFMTGIEDINNAKYNVYDKKLHLSFMATKIALTKDDIPSSLHRDYEIVSSSKRLTPAIKDSLLKLSAFTENSIEKEITKRQKREFVDKFNSKGDLNSSRYVRTNGNVDVTKAQTDYICGRINKEEFTNLKNEFNNRNRHFISQAKSNQNYI